MKENCPWYIQKFNICAATTKICTKKECAVRYWTDIIYKNGGADAHKKELASKIGCIPIMSDGAATDDSVAIALATYFESLPDCPKDYVDDETGWSRWAMDKTDDVLKRIVEMARTG